MVGHEVLPAGVARRSANQTQVANLPANQNQIAKAHLGAERSSLRFRAQLLQRLFVEDRLVILPDRTEIRTQASGLKTEFCAGLDNEDPHARLPFHIL
jgi:hypothetical protein